MKITLIEPDLWYSMATYQISTHTHSHLRLLPII